MNEYIFFGLFTVFIVFILLLDLGVFSKKDHIVSFREAAIWSVFWVLLALGFWQFLAHYGDIVHGIETFDELKEIVSKYVKPNQASGLIVEGNFEQSLDNYRGKMSIDFITGYLLEYSLSVDNIFVMIMIFTSFGVREKFYKKVLFWGILGAIVMRFGFIFLGATLIENAHWVLYVFGGFLIYTGLKMFYDFIKGGDDEDEHIDVNNHVVVKYASKIFNIYPRFVGNHFFVKPKVKNAKWAVTPLFIVILVIEFSDLIFAVDSIPAIFAVTQDPYVVFFSNIFAIMGLRSMFFFLSNIMHFFHYLDVGLSFVLTYIGVKMLAADWLHDIGFKNEYSIYIILGILGLSILASVLFPKKEEAEVPTT